MKESLRRKLVRSWLKWAGHMERLEGEEEDRDGDGELNEETFGSTGMEWRMRVRDGGVETGSETGSVAKKKEKKNLRPVSPRTTGIKCYRCQPQPGLQG